jgi:2-hydroxychromene-2-carboxylate isomerase
MPDPIRFYFDFASPYGYFASTRIEALAEEFGRTVEWRPILLWAVFKTHGIAPPMDLSVRRDYLLHDMARSAAFFDVPIERPRSSRSRATSRRGCSTRRCRRTPTRP